MTLEERQQRAENDELSTVELPLFILDNSSTVDKIKEWNRRKVTPHSDLAVKRDDMRIQVILNLPHQIEVAFTVDNLFFRPRCHMIE